MEQKLIAVGIVHHDDPTTLSSIKSTKEIVDTLEILKEDQKLLVYSVFE